jgi:hypothetical protein
MLNFIKSMGRLNQKTAQTIIFHFLGFYTVMDKNTPTFSSVREPNQTKKSPLIPASVYWKGKKTMIGFNSKPFTKRKSYNTQTNINIH